MLDYVKIEGYKVKFRNRELTRGGSVDLHIRSDIRYKLRNDIANTNTDIEHLWLEVTLRNENSNLLLGIFYHRNFDNFAKLLCWSNLMIFYSMHAPDGATQLLFPEI